MTLENKVIIVTGSDGLIGTEIIKNIKKYKGTAIRFDINVETDETINLYNCDITNKESIDENLLKVLKKHTKIDGLVNNAYPRTKDWGTKFEDIPIQSWNENVSMQLGSVFYMSQAVLKIMNKQSFGSIVNIGSIYGIVGNDFSLYEEFGGTSPAAYSAIKAGTINLTKYLASYYGEKGIRVNCISPGGVLDEKNQHPSFIKRYSEKSPLKRLANPIEIAPPISFLLSEEASFITGHNLVVDGGWTSI